MLIPKLLSYNAVAVDAADGSGVALAEEGLDGLVVADALGVVAVQGLVGEVIGMLGHHV